MKTETTTEASHSEQQAIAQLESIIEMVRAMDKETAAQDYAKELTREKCVELLESASIQCYDTEDLETLQEAVASNIEDGTLEPDDFEFDEDSARERIQEDALSVQVRSGWFTPGHEAEKLKPAEFEILLCTGGPACRIIGDLDDYGQPDSCRLQHQDWGTPWTEHFLNSEQRDYVLTYCRVFYFGE